MPTKEKPHNIGIYKITSPTGRIYIGQSKDLKTRFRDYYKLIDNIKTQTKLYNSFKKYGVENHQFDIIEYCTEEELNCSERFWQDEFDVLNGGLNCILQECGEKRRILSEETRKKLSEAGKKRIHSQESIAKRVKSFKENHKGKRSPCLGVKYSQELRDKMSKAQMGRIVSEETRKKIGDANRGQKRTFSKEHRESISKSITKETAFSKRKIILCLRTGIFYFGAEEASEARGISKGMIWEHLTRLKVNRLDLIYV